MVVAYWPGSRGGSSVMRRGLGGVLESEASGSSTEGAAVDRRKIPVLDPMRRDVSSQASQSLGKCLAEWDHAEFVACVRQVSSEPVSPVAVAELCRLAGVRDPRIIALLEDLLPRLPAASVFEYIDELCFAFGDDAELQVTIELIFDRLMQSNREWTSALGDGILAKELFSGSKTEGPIIATAMLARADDELIAVLHDGATGMWGGTGPQIMRAIAASGGLLRESPEDALWFFYSVYESDTLPSFPEVGGMLVAQLSFPQFIVDNDPSLNCDLILAILQDPRYRRQAAKQLYSMYGVSAPSWIADELWIPVSSELRVELGK
jgi:hypothetical protein